MSLFPIGPQSIFQTVGGLGWPYGADGILNVTSGTVNLAASSIHDYESITVNPGAILNITGNGQVCVLGCKKDFINNGTVIYRQTGNAGTFTPPAAIPDWKLAVPSYTTSQNAGGTGGVGYVLGTRISGYGGATSQGHGGGGGGSSRNSTWTVNGGNGGTAGNNGGAATSYSTGTAWTPGTLGGVGTGSLSYRGAGQHGTANEPYYSGGIYGGKGGNGTGGGGAGGWYRSQTGAASVRDPVSGFYYVIDQYVLIDLWDMGGTNMLLFWAGVSYLVPRNGGGYLAGWPPFDYGGYTYYLEGRSNSEAAVARVTPSTIQQNVEGFTGGGGGGSRGYHGGGLFIKTWGNVSGAGTFNLSGENGFNGGNGGNYHKKYSPQSGDQSSNSYGGGGGGAGAGGSGGRIWIYHKGDLTVSNILYAGGSGGSGGAAGTSAGGGGNGVNGGAGALVNVQL